MDNNEKRYITLLDNISTVGQLKEMLELLPQDASLNPFGSSDCRLVYDIKNNLAYIDEEFYFLDDYDDCEDPWNKEDIIEAISFKDDKEE